MEMAYLADQPEHINTLTEWLSKNWGSDEGGFSQEEWRTKLLQHLNTKSIPLTIVALHHKRCVGTASLVFHDLKGQNHLSPWLSYVYVTPECRNKGIGTYLVKTLIRKAQMLGCTKLYSYQCEPLVKKFKDKYLGLGLNAIDKINLNNESIIIMEIDPKTMSGHLSSHETIKSV